MVRDLFDGCHDQVLVEGLTWLHEPPEWRFDDGELLIVPAAQTDFFRPYQGASRDNACLLYTEVTGDFTAVTEASAHLVGFGDAAALTVRAGPTQWAKLCLERSPIGDISAVSVVTNPTSDDANNELLDDPACFLRITRKGDVFGMHYSLDGEVWRFVRTFGMAMPQTVMVGVHAQAPYVGGCWARFAGLSLSSEPVADFRSGE
jgi:regulation of enolase protein 1 (concanavalin A-like superfamily)